jgi:hypothetical protein
VVAGFRRLAAGLSRNEKAVANGLHAVRDAGGNAAFGNLFASLDATAAGSPSARDPVQQMPLLPCPDAAPGRLCGKRSAQGSLDPSVVVGPPGLR